VVAIRCKETIALEIEKQSLKEMSEIKDSVTTASQHPGFMIKAFDKTTCLSVGEVETSVSLIRLDTPYHHVSAKIVRIRPLSCREGGVLCIAHYFLPC